MINPLYKSKTEKFHEDNKIVGAYICSKKAAWLSLYSLTTNQTKQKILQVVLEDFIKTLPPEDELIKTMTAQIIEKWKELKKENKGQPNWELPREIGLRKRQYKDKIVKTLTSSKLDANQIHSIVFQMENELK